MDRANDEPRRPVTGRAFIALLPVLLVYAFVTVADPSGLDSLSDQWRYLAYADHITHGFYAQDHAAPDLFLWHGPLLPLLLAPFVALDIPVEVTQVLLGPLPLFAALLVFHRLALMHLAPRGALIATYALAAYLPFLTVIPTIHVEPVTTLLFTLAALFLVHAYRRQDTAEALWAGLMLGLVALSRVEYGWVVLVALVLSGVWWLVSRRTPSARLSVVAAGAAFLLCVPWLAYTFAKTEKPLYWGNSGGLSLYWMTAPGTVGDWHGLGEPLRNPKLAKARPLFTEIRSLDPEAQDARLQHVALQNIRHDPKRYASNVINNLGRLVFESPYSFTGEQSRTMLYSLPNGLLLGALLAAVLVGLKVRRTLTPDIVPIAVLTLLGFGLHAFVSGYGRMVIPLVPALAWLALAVLADHVRIPSRPAYGVGSAQAPP